MIQQVQIDLDPCTGRVVVAYDQSMEEFVETFLSIERFREVRFPAAKSIDLRMFAKVERNEDGQQEVPQSSSSSSEGADLYAEVHARECVPRAGSVEAKESMPLDQRSTQVKDYNRLLLREFFQGCDKKELYTTCGNLIKVWIPNRIGTYPYSSRFKINAAPPQWPEGVPYNHPQQLRREQLIILAATIVIDVAGGDFKDALKLVKRKLPRRMLLGTEKRLLDKSKIAFTQWLERCKEKACMRQLGPANSSL